MAESNPAGDCGGGAEVKLTPAQTLLGIHLKELGLGEVEYEYKFHPERKWRADLAIPAQRLLFECDGGQFHGGHKRGLALAADYDKQNYAVLAGWRILRFTNVQILTGKARDFLHQHLSLVDASPRGQRHSRRAKVGAMENE